VVEAEARDGQLGQQDVDLIEVPPQPEKAGKEKRVRTPTADWATDAPSQERR